jgi:hypothetical protein
MKFHEHNTYRGSVMFGLLLAAAGVLLLLGNFGVIALQPYWMYWPMILVALAASKMIFPKHRKQFAEGVWLLTLGAWLQLSILGWYGLNFSNSWPMLLVGFGIHLLITPHKSHYRHPIVEVHHVS